MLLNDVLSSQELFQSYFEHHPDGQLLIDAEGRIRQANTAILSMLAFAREELLQTPLDRYIDPADAIGFGDGRIAASKLECSVRHSQGHLLEIRLTCASLRSDEQ